MAGRGGNAMTPGEVQGKLYIVATPIGNLEDITLRALKVLRSVDLIAAEDTRRTRILLSAYEISTPVTSLYDQIEAKKSGALVAKLEEGQSIAYVSDAGTPGISDPGYVLVNEAIDRGIAVVPIPGAVAVVAALCASGLPMHAFVFQGFLPPKSAARRAMLKELSTETRTLAFYESPNRLVATLEDVLDILGDRRVVVARELTKVFEELLRGPVREVLEKLRERTIKGEITLMVAGRDPAPPEYTDEDIRARLEASAVQTGLSGRELINRVTCEMDLPRKRVYRIAVKADRDEV